MPRRRRRSEEQVEIPNVQVVMRDIHEIAPYEDNPRDNADAVQSVANSIQTFGFLVPMVIDGDGVIVAGHTRYAAAQSLGLTEVPTVVADHLSEEQIKAFRLIDNKVAELARWDFDLLAGELTTLQESGINFTEFGWTNDEIDCLTEVVADDCLTLGSSEYTDEHNERAQQRTPTRARFVLGEFVFFIEQDEYREWATNLRNECDFDEEAIITRLKQGLGLPL